jgi:hypothetical protein
LTSPGSYSQTPEQKGWASPHPHFDLDSEIHNPDEIIDKGAPSSSLRSLEGQGGDFDFARLLIADSRTERAGQPHPHFDLDSEIHNPDGIIDKGAPSSSLRSLEGQGGDFDFARLLIADSRTERAGQPHPHFDLDSEIHNPDGIIDKGAPSSSLRSLEGQGGDFDFACA